MKKIAASALMVGLAIVLSCGGDGEGGTVSPEALLFAMAGPYSSDSLQARADFMSEVLPDSADCELRINNAVLDEWIDGPYFNFWGTAPGTASASLSFTSGDFGNATGQVTIPEEATEITEPGDEDTLPADQDILVQWTDVPSDFYTGYVNVEFYDSSGYWLAWRSWNFNTRNASYTIPADSLTYTNMAYADVDFGVTPVYGPFVEPGAQGNLSGDVKGFLWGFGYETWIGFYVGTPVKGFVSRGHEEPSPADHLKQMRELLGY